MITAGKGKYKVWLKQKKIGEDLILILGGGERSHIGGVVLCEPGKSARVIKLENHYDDVVLKPLAEAACRKHQKTVVAIGGIHINHATKEEIVSIVKNCHELTNSL